VRKNSPYVGVKFCTVTETELFECPYLTPLHFCLWLDEEQLFKNKVVTPDELPASILDAAAYIK